MKLRNIAFDVEETPTTFTFDMTTDEVALLYRFAGHTQASLVATYGQRWAEALQGLCVAADALNTVFEDGVDGVAPRMNLVRRTDD